MNVAAVFIYLPFYIFINILNSRYIFLIHVYNVAVKGLMSITWMKLIGSRIADLETKQFGKLKGAVNLDGLRGYFGHFGRGELIKNQKECIYGVL